MLRTRVLTALVLLTVLGVVMTVLPPWAGHWTLLGVLAAGAWEWAAFAGFSTAVSRMTYVAATLLLGFLTEQGVRTSGVYPLMMLASVWWIVTAARIVFAPDRLGVGMTVVAGWLTLLPAVVAVAKLYEHLRVDGNWYFLILVSLVAAADIGAYFAGRRFGRRKLAPLVSPGKTWEGVLGGAAAVSAVALGWVAVGLFPSRFVLVALAVFAASVVGDLSESLFKRSVGVKDSGTLLPGHGGVLDRIDSLTAAAPVYVLGLHWIGTLW